MLTPIFAASPLPAAPPATPADDFSLVTYFPVFIYLVAVIVTALANLGLAHLPLLKPYKDTAVKHMPYESGMDPRGDARFRFDVKFYLIAILFLVFDLELLFLYPWAIVAYRQDGEVLLPAGLHQLVFWEVILFLVTLVLGYVYAWRKGVFQWR